MDLASGSKLAPMSWTFAFADGNPCPPPYPFFRLEPPPVTREVPRYLKLVYSSGFMSGTPVSYPDWHALVGNAPRHGGHGLPLGWLLMRRAMVYGGGQFVRHDGRYQTHLAWGYPLMGSQTHTSSSLSAGERTQRTVSLLTTFSSAFQSEEPPTI